MKPTLGKRRARTVLSYKARTVSSYGTGLWDCCVAVLLGVMASWSAFAAEGPIPPLRPVRGELAPGFWELYGGWFVLGMALLAAATVAVLRYHRRKNPAIPTPPDVLARQALEILRGRTEDVALVTEVSRLLRQYLVAAFGLPPEELTLCAPVPLNFTVPVPPPAVAPTSTSPSAAIVPVFRLPPVYVNVWLIVPVPDTVIPAIGFWHEISTS